jgi:hypothetical protein
MLEQKELTQGIKPSVATVNCILLVISVLAFLQINWPLTIVLDQKVLLPFIS